MGARSRFGWLIVLAALCAWPGCKGKSGAPKAADGAALDLRCATLAKGCADSDKHAEKILASCKESAKQQVAKGCADKVIALYDCYQKQVCGKTDKVWAIADLHVLSARHGKCKTEEAAFTACAGN